MLKKIKARRNIHSVANHADILLFSKANVNSVMKLAITKIHDK